MRLRLILTREVQVNIRLLIALKSKEGLERNVKTILMELFAADGAHFIRHVDSRLAGVCLHLVGIKVDCNNNAGLRG